MLANDKLKIVLFADDTSTIVTYPNQVELKFALQKNLADINSWFKANFLSLNMNKTCILHFRNSNSIENTLAIKYMNISFLNVQSVKFLGLLVDDALSWDKYINQTASNLSSVCYAVRALAPLLTINAFKMLYFSYAHSIISYGIIFWGAFANSIKIFRLQKKIISIMTK